jgi:hypothetical protein
MNAAVRISPETLRIADQQFIAHLRTASRKQLYAMRQVFARLGDESSDWKRAAVESRIAKLEGLPAPHAFAWVREDRWWENG